MKSRLFVIMVAIGMSTSIMATDYVFLGASATGEWSNALSWAPRVPRDNTGGGYLYLRCDGTSTYDFVTFDSSLYTGGKFTVSGRVAIGLYDNFTLSIPSGEMVFAPTITIPDDVADEDEKTIIGFASEKYGGEGATTTVELTGSGKLTLGGARDAIIGFKLASNADGHAVINVAGNAELVCNLVDNDLILGNVESATGVINISGNGSVVVGRATDIVFGSSNSFINFVSGSNAVFKHQGKSKSYYEKLVAKGYLRLNSKPIKNLDQAFVYSSSKIMLTKSVLDSVNIKTSQKGPELSWTVTDESKVEIYKLVDNATNELLEIMVAGEQKYSTTIDETITVRLVVVGVSGRSKEFLLRNGRFVEI